MDDAHTMGVLRQAMTYIILILLFWGVVLAIKAFSRVQVPSGYSDIANVNEFTSYRVDQTVTLSAWRPSDVACWRLGADADRAVNFGWIAALPGDQIQVHDGHLEVNGHVCPHGDVIALPDCGPVRIPDGHFYVVSDRHQNDSVAHGPLPISALRGRVGTFP
jgi:hypothetical protein